MHVTLPDVRAAGAHLGREVNPVVDQERNTGPVEGLPQLCAERHELFVGGLRIT